MAPWATGPSRKQRKAKADRTYDLNRARARETAYNRAHGCCQRCGAPLVLKPSAARHEFEIAHAHEEPSRAHGGDATDDRFIVILCYQCHDLMTSNREHVHYTDPDLMARGPIEFRKGSKKSWRETTDSAGSLLPSTSEINSSRCG